MRITLVISSLGSGGAERVLSNMANYWVTKGWTVALISFANADADFYSLDTRVLRITLNATKKSSNILAAITNNLCRIFKLRGAIRSCRPDVVISFIDNVNTSTLLATRLTRTRVIVAERVDPTQHQIGKVWSYLRIWLYPRASMLIVQTQHVLKWATLLVGESNVQVIPNPISEFVGLPAENTDKFPQPFILAVGRLARQKGFDLLLLAFERLAIQHPSWSLVILGEGEERHSLEAQIQKLKLENRVCLYGRHDNPASVMSQASLFVLSSRFEGFPNALLEAMACKLPVISFDCPSGPREIIRNGVDGILVEHENVDALVIAMQDLINHPEKRKLLGLRAAEVMDRFSFNRVMRMWEELLENVQKERV